MIHGNFGFVNENFNKKLYNCYNCNSSNITRAKVFGSIVSIYSNVCILSFLILLKKELVELDCSKVLAEYMDLIYGNETFKLINTQTV